MIIGKKWSLVLVILLTMSMLFAGCTSGKIEDSSEEPDQQPIKVDYDTATPSEIESFITAKSNNPDKIILKYASTSRNLDDQPYLRGLRKYLFVLKSEVGDQIEIQYFMNSALGSSTEAVLGGIQNRSFELTDWPLGSFAELTNTFQVFDVPYLVTKNEEAMEYLNGKIGDIMTAKLIEDTNIRPLGYFTIGMRQLTNNEKEVKSPVDMEGLKVRVQNNQLHILGMKALGCAPTPLAFAELFTALQQGVVDGQENPVPTIYDLKFYEVQKYLTVTNHLFTGGTIAINEDFYQSLPDNVKTAMDKAAIAGSEESLNEVLNSQADLLTKLSENMQVYQPTAEELKVFQDKAKEAWPEMEGIIGKEYFNQIIDAMK